MLAQTEGEEEKGADTTDHMDLDPQTLKFVLAVTPTAKDPINSTPTSAHCARAFVVHSVACSGPLTHKIREVERAFGGKGGGVIGVRWLLQWNRRRGKTASSIVVDLKRAVPTALEMSVRIWGRKHTVVEYEWGRKGSEVAAW